MSRRTLFRHSCALALLSAPVFASAAPVTDPQFTFGLLGSYNDFRFQGGSQNDKDHIGEGGVFANFGNKMTGESGLIYQVGAQAKYFEDDGDKLKEAQADLDIGWRAALDARNFVDVLVGAGYSWSRYEIDLRREDVELSNKAPFAKAALGYNHQFDTATLRVEAGARHTIDGRAKIKVKDFGHDSVDLKDRLNPYAEVSLLMNRDGDLPIFAGLYYEHTIYKLDESTYIADDTRLKRHEYGVKVGLAF
ncbi:outer membrane beta-barrel protein [Pseudomonas cremoricolorata]|uniref:outer membrane beta-barrel protein n=1 Tax=Pseudomonas cremoricolorata TaxID=157783 RepID=UPI00040DDDCA|nr:outer membrane beta-barrel protein [Pseudomonas cremoricolorata]